MKKFLSALLLSIVCAFTAIGFVACSNKEIKVDFIVDGKTYSSVTIYEPGTVKLPAVDPKLGDGWKFEGWFLDVGGTTEFNTNTVVSANTKVYAKFIAVHVHDMKAEVVAPTCTESGHTRYYCDCGKVSYVDPDSVTPALGHSWSDWTVVEPTCEKAGNKTRTCSRCGAVETLNIDALGHSYVYVNETAGYCNEGGMYAHNICSNCGSYFDNDLNETRLKDLEKHKFVKEIENPTCEHNGFDLYYCQICECTKCVFYKFGENDNDDLYEYVNCDAYDIIELEEDNEEHASYKALGHDPNLVFVSDNNATFKENGTEHSTTECPRCHKIVTREEKCSALKIDLYSSLLDLTIDSENLDKYVARGTIANDPDARFDFTTAIIGQDDGVTFEIRYDPDDQNSVVQPDDDDHIIVNPEVGDNTYYIIINYTVKDADDNDVAMSVVYKVIIHRNEMYQVTFDANDGSWDDEPITQISVDVEEGKTVSVPVNPTRDGGWTFDGWRTNEGEDFDSSSLIDGNITINAKWEQREFVLSNSSDVVGGEVAATYNNAPASGEFITAGEKIALSVTETYAGYTFYGWYDGNTLISTEPTGYEYTMQNRNVEIKAKWTKYAVSVGINYADAGSIKIAVDGGEFNQISGNEKANVSAGANVTFIAECPYDGYTFLGWYYRDVLVAKTEVFNFTMPQDDVIYTAKWGHYWLTTAEYTSGYNGGSIVRSYNKQYFSEGDEINLTATTNVGYKFLGWYNGSKLLSSKETYDFTMPSENVTITAKWQANKVKYVVNHYKQDFDGNYILVDSDDTKTAFTDSQVTVSNLNYENYKFNSNYQGNVVAQKIAGDGSSVFSLYYDIDKVTITVYVGNGVELSGDDDIEFTYKGESSDGKKYTAEVNYKAIVPNITATSNTGSDVTWSRLVGGKYVSFDPSNTLAAFIAYKDMTFRVGSLID